MIVYFALFERIWHERLCTRLGPVMEGRKDAGLRAFVAVIQQLKPKIQSQLIYTDTFRSTGGASGQIKCYTRTVTTHLASSSCNGKDDEGRTMKAKLNSENTCVRGLNLAALYF